MLNCNITKNAEKVSLQFSRTAQRNVCLTRNLHFSFLFGTTTTKRSIFPMEQDSGAPTLSPRQSGKSNFKGRAGETLLMLSVPRPVPHRNNRRLQKKQLLKVAGRAKTLKQTRRAPKPFLFREPSLWANELQIIPPSLPLQRSPNDTLSVNLMCFKLSPCLATYLECPLRTAKKSQAGKKNKKDKSFSLGPWAPTPAEGRVCRCLALPFAHPGKAPGRWSWARRQLCDTRLGLNFSPFFPPPPPYPS